jgi:hypothetical protein
MLRMTGSGVELNGVVRAGVDAPGRRALPWEATGRMDVEALVSWAFLDQRVGAAAAGLNEMEALAAGLSWQHRSTCGCARMEQIGTVGKRVDVSPGQSESDVHPVAEAVLACIEASADRDVLIPWARSGAKPGGWAVPAKWVEPVNGWVEGERFHKAAAIYDLVGGAAGGVRRALPVQFRDPAVALAEVAARRAVYGDWWQAVRQLAFDLSLRNMGFQVMGPVSPAQPWVDALGDGATLETVPPSDGVVLWWARWDALSMQMVAALDAMGDHGVTLIEADEAPRQAMAMNVRALPTMMVMRGGQASAVTVGFQNSKALGRWLMRAAQVGA